LSKNPVAKCTRNLQRRFREEKNKIDIKLEKRGSAKKGAVKMRQKAARTKKKKVTLNKAIDQKKNKRRRKNTWGATVFRANMTTGSCTLPYISKEGKTAGQAKIQTEKNDNTVNTISHAWGQLGETARWTEGKRDGSIIVTH